MKQRWKYKSPSHNHNCIFVDRLYRDICYSDPQSGGNVWSWPLSGSGNDRNELRHHVCELGLRVPPNAIAAPHYHYD